MKRKKAAPANAASKEQEISPVAKRGGWARCKKNSTIYWLELQRTLKTFATAESMFNIDRTLLCYCVGIFISESI